MTHATGPSEPEPPLYFRFERKEVDLLRTGLEMLEDTFGHEEADELAEVQALLAKLAGRQAGQRRRS